MKETINDIFKHEAAAINNIPITDSYDKVIDLLFNYIHQKGGKLVTSGMGKAGQIALNMATTFSSTGTPAVFIHPSEAQHGDLGLVQENDVMLLISNSGRTREIIELVGLTKGLYQHIPMVVITGNKLSELGNIADYVIETGNPEEVCTLKLSPTTSTTVMTVIGDALVVLLMKKINFTAIDYAKRHHGGYLGEKSRSIK